MTVSTLRFALIGLGRDWRGGELRLLALTLTLAVAAVTSVGFFTDRVDQALRQQGHELLAADLVIEAPQPLPQIFTDQAQRLGLATSHTLSFPSVLLGPQGPQLVQVKAVDAGYPLRGQLILRDGPGASPYPMQGAPEQGRIWVEPRLLALLPAALGAKVSLGRGEFTLSRLIALESDRGGSLFQLAPRVLLNQADVPATGLVTPASRVTYRLLLAGSVPAVRAFRAWAGERLSQNARLLGIEDARPELRAALDRGAQFLALAALVAVLVTGAAVALASRRLVERQADQVAILRCLGASSHLLRGALLLRLLVLILLTGLVGALLGYLAQGVLGSLLGDWLAQALPAPSVRPLLTGIATAALTLLGFALPALLHLPQVSPLRVLRRDLGPTPPTPWVVGLSALAVLGLLLYGQAGDARLAGTVLGGVLVLLAALALSAWLLVGLVGRLQRHVTGIRRFGLASLSRQAGTTVLQICGFGLGIMAILLLAVVRVDLLAVWAHTLPPTAPNRFLINILPEQTADLAAFLRTQGLADSGLHPMIRGRLTHINDRAVVPEDYSDPRAQRLAEREFNLSYGLTPQADNRIVAGRFWDGPEAPPQLSVERGIAEALGIRLGDRLTYWVAGQTLSAPVTSLRSVQWDSFNVNFFVIAPPSLLRDQPATYITSFFLPAEREGLEAELIRRFPNTTLLDVSSLMTQVRGIVARGSLAVEYVFLFTLAAGLLVLYAGIQAGAEGRRREAAILRTLGARRSQLLGAAAVEFAALGLLAGLLATLGAAVTGQLLAQRVLGLDYGFSPGLWLAGVGGAMLGIGLAGVLSAWPLVIRPPLQSLRRAE